MEEANLWSVVESCLSNDRIEKTLAQHHHEALVSFLEEEIVSHAHI
ncbi:MAG: hypothetical protein HC884_16545 [Chloroflexaceae bacterium]|nr:hypothetical protein [Chloroflexaceae bacterium]